MRLTATSTVIAGVLATAALASPLASARPNLDPPTSHARSSATAPADLQNPDQHSSHVSQVGPPIVQPAAAAHQSEVHPDQWAALYGFAYRPPVSARDSTAALNGYGRAPTGGTVGRAALLRSLAQQERQRVAALSAYREGQLATARDVAGTAANKASAPQTVVRVHAPQSGFDWGDAGIGAAGGLISAVLIIGGGVLVARHRQPSPNRVKALA